ncbi:MAG: hypothetical protein RLZZ148_1545 [Cyanobacteriota bacterium]
MTRIWYAAQRNNLNIPFPIRTLYHFHGPTSLAQGTEKKFYGETVVHQGSVNNALYVLISGQAAMRTIDKQGKLQELLILKNGEFFGEMSLFSNEPSPVSITSITDLEVMKMSPTIVNQMLERQPSFARELSQIFESLRKAVQEMQG